MENKRTDYSKTTKRTKPQGVRFSIEDFQIAKREFAVKTAQGLVDKLMEKWKRDKFFENPVLAAQINRQEIPTHPLPTNLDPFQSYLLELKNANSIAEIQGTMREVKKDSRLSPAEKANIEATAIFLSREISF